MKHIYIFALISFCLLGCDDDSDVSPVETLPEVEYQLYSEFLDYILIDTLVVQKESNGDLATAFLEPTVESGAGQAPQGRIDPEVLKQILVENENVIVYEDRFTSDEGKVIYTQDEAEFTEIFRNGNSTEEQWNEFQLRYGESAHRVGFSRIAYNDDNTEAAYVANISRYQYAAGFVAYFERIGNRWQVRDIVIVWTT